MGNLESSSNEKFKINSEFQSYKFGHWIINKGTFNSTHKYVNICMHHASNRQMYDCSIQHIKCLKRLRHPNIIKYIYSATNELNLESTLITEPFVPLLSILNDLKQDELLNGLFSITCAIDFLHTKASISHNNVCESSLCLNTGLVWKLNSFECSIDYINLNKTSFNRVRDYKHKKCVLPEENNVQLLDLIFSSKEHYHSIDAYCWAQMVSSLINDKINDSHLLLTQYLNSDPTKRPTLDKAIHSSLFKRSTDDEQKVDLDLFNKHNLLKLNDGDAQSEKFFNDLIDSLNENECVNESAIDFLLQPYMFFLSRARKDILPFILRPSNNENDVIVQRNHDKSIKKLLINEDKYKSFVLPRLLNLFLLRILQIRLVLLEYFKYYVYLINDQDTLKYELLPELLIGLKDENDDLVSYTFNALAIMVKIVGHEVVIGKSKNSQKKYFSNNYPKLINEDNIKLVNKSTTLSDDMESIHELKEKLTNTTDSMIALNEFQFNDDHNLTSNDFELSTTATTASFIHQISQSEPTRKHLTLQSSFKMNNLNDFSSEYDIKNINIKVSNKDDDYFANMEPKVVQRPNPFIEINTKNGWNNDFEFDD